MSVREEIKMPRMVKIRQKFPRPVCVDIASEVKKEVAQFLHKLPSGARVAIAVGSRGISNIKEVAAAVVQEVKGCEAKPFIVPAMGSHGGATAEGQKKVLESYGINEHSVGAPIVSSMEVIKIGILDNSVPVYFDKNASQADAIIPINRVKPHTDFHDEIESGIAKIMVIGLGKHKGALSIHRHGAAGLHHLVPAAARLITEKMPIVFGVAMVENAYHETALIEAIGRDELEEKEKKLLLKAKELMPHLPSDKIDVLIVEEMGKNISGSGMDTNIIGRMMILGEKEPSSPQIKRIVILDLSQETHGNAAGLGLADFITRKLFKKMNYEDSLVNILTARFIIRGKIPLTLDNDREAMEIALDTCWGVEPEKARVVRIKNTLKLDEVYISEALTEELTGRDDIEIIDKLEEMEFDKEGNLASSSLL